MACSSMKLLTNTQIIYTTYNFLYQGHYVIWAYCMCLSICWYRLSKLHVSDWTLGGIWIYVKDYFGQIWIYIQDFFGDKSRFI